MRIHRAVRIAAALLAAIPVLAPGAATAWPEDRPGARVVRHRIHVRPMPPVPPPVLVWDYRPRNLNVPMYNVPPPRGPLGGPAW